MTTLSSHQSITHAGSGGHTMAKRKAVAATRDVLADAAASDFIFLIRHTRKGLDTLAASPNRAKATYRFVTDTLQARCSVATTTGTYDAVSFFSGTDEQAYKFLLYLRSLGTVDVDMLKVQAHSTEQYAQIIQSIGPARS